MEEKPSSDVSDYPSAHDGDANRPASERFQFSLRSLFLLMVVGALIAACVTAIPLPDGLKIVFLLYFLFMAAYLLLRLPFLLRGIRRKTTGGEKVRRQQAELERLVDEKRKK